MSRPRRIDVVVVYKVDRLTRSLADFAKLVETFDAHGVSFDPVLQHHDQHGTIAQRSTPVLAALRK